MGAIPTQVFDENTPGVYTDGYTILEATPDGTFDVAVTLTVPGAGTTTAVGPRITILKRPPPPPPPAPGTQAPSDTSFGATPEWVDWLANVIGWAVVLWGMAAAATAFGFFTFPIAIALAALAYIFRAQLVEPIQRAIKQIIISLFNAILDIVKFISAWLEATIKYFQGDFLRAVVRIFLVAAFLWVFELALQIPAFKQLFDFVLETTKKVTDFVNGLFDQLLVFVNDARKYVDARITDLLGNLGDIGKALRDDILAIVNRLFSGLDRQIQSARFELLARVDVVQALMTAQITVMGERIKLLPDEARRYIRNFYAGSPKNLAEDLGYIASTWDDVIPPDAPGKTAWLDEVESFKAATLAALEGTPPPWMAELADFSAIVAATGATTA